MEILSLSPVNTPRHMLVHIPPLLSSALSFIFVPNILMGRFTTSTPGNEILFHFTRNRK